MSKLVIYHKNCWDGLAAAWCLRKAFPDASFLPALHDDPLPEAMNADVYLVDFVYDKRDQVEELKKRAKSVLILDHHKTAQENLKDLDYCYFDLMRSGAGIAWDYFFPNQKRPWIISYIEDRDLWKMALPASEAINAAIHSYPKEFATIEDFSQIPWDGEIPDGVIEHLISDGEAIVRRQNEIIKEILTHLEIINFEGYQIPLVNTPVLQSEIGAKLSEQYPFSLTWHCDSRKNYFYSLRSKEIDVGNIAVKYGGGGHQRAAGFRLKYLLS